MFELPAELSAVFPATKIRTNYRKNSIQTLAKLLLHGAAI